MKIVGVGAAPNLLTQEAIETIRNAKKIYGSKRAIELVSEFIPPNCDCKEIKDYRKLDKIPEEAVVLSTGDPMLSGLGFLKGEVIPGISSLQLASAKLKIDLCNIITITAHGRNIKEARERILEAVKGDKLLFILPDPKNFGVYEICDLVNKNLKKELEVAVCENLGYPNERIVIGTINNPPVCKSKLYCILIGHNLRKYEEKNVNNPK